MDCVVEKKRLIRRSAKKKWRADPSSTRRHKENGRRVFLTGATGFIGEAIVRGLLTAGHQVLGLARSDASAEALTRLGIEAHRGDLSDTESFVAGARACDGVIHTALIHDFSVYAAAAETDRRAVEALPAR